jgi:L-ascorbate metabolism protein UlaG (beta-lactamase superfamily)
MRKHPVLEKFHAMELGEKELAIVWTGQNGFLVKSRNCVVYFDPYLSDFAEQWTYGWENEHVRMAAIPFQPKELYGVDYVLCSHDHVDHIDPYTIPIVALRNPDTRFVSPLVAKQRMQSFFVQEKNLILLKGEDNFELPNIKIHAIPAAHSKLTHDEDNGFHFLSYIVEIDGITIFHAGDTVPYDKQTGYFENFEVDIAFLPINGYQAPELDFEPNFSIDEAIRFAKSIHAKTVVPMHYDMYTLNTANIADFVEKANGIIDYKVAQNGVPFKI